MSIRIPVTSPSAHLSTSGSTRLSTRMILQLLREGEAVRFVARGRSMWPTLPSRSLVHVSPCDATDLQVGDIAAFDRGGEIVLHRVVQVDSDTLLFAGDSASTTPEAVPLTSVLGSVTVVQRRPLRLRNPSRAELRWLFQAAVLWLKRR